MNILYWDIENLNTLKNEGKFKNINFDIVQCCFAKPFKDIETRIKLPNKTINNHQLHSRGPDLADFHLLSLLNMDIQEHGRDHNFFIATHDKLLSYRFIVLARNLNVNRNRIIPILSDLDIRKRSKRGYDLFEEGDREKIPKELKGNI